jgi:hypothetical protein
MDIKRGRLSIKAEGSFSPTASDTTFEIPLQITLIANQNSAIMSAQSAQRPLHRYFLMVSFIKTSLI